MQGTKRTARSPLACYRSPVTGEVVKHSDLEDPEMLVIRELIQAGMRDAAGIVRLTELNHQSIQNRARIQKRCFNGVDGKAIVQERPVNAWRAEDLGETEQELPTYHGAEAA